jgi:hypothetical protein
MDPEGVPLPPQVSLENRDKEPSPRQLRYIKRLFAYFGRDADVVAEHLVGKLFEEVTRYDAGVIIDHFVREFVVPERRRRDSFRRSLVTLLAKRIETRQERARLQEAVTAASRSKAKDRLDAHVRRFGDISPKW